MPSPSLFHYVPIVDSTNNYARKHWHTLPDKACVYCDVQSAGKGRCGRTWLSDSHGTITMSFILKRQAYMDSPISTWTALTHYAALTLCHTLQDYAIDARIKWPNDVLVNGKKIAGILAEGVLNTVPDNASGDASSNQTTDAFLGIVLGIGINVSLNDGNLRDISVLGGQATSIYHCINHHVEHETLMQNYVKYFFARYNVFMQGGFSCIYNEYNEFSSSLQQIVTIKTPKIHLMGKAKDITLNGELILIDTSGIEHILSTGELL